MTKIVDSIYEKFSAVLEQMAQHPENITEADRNKLDKLYSRLCKALGISEHSQWRVQWQVEKWFDAAKHFAGCKPDEIAVETQNIILDSGANEMLKLITGTGGTAYSSSNSYIYVGTDSTAEKANQNGILSSTKTKGQDYDYASVTSVNVTGRQAVFTATFNETAGNFAWNEAAITNGTGVGSIAMNRKVDNLGTKNGGIWTLQITISLTSV